MSNATIHLAGKHELSIDDAVAIMDRYPRLTVRVYDIGGDRSSDNAVTAEDLGRLLPIEPLSQRVAVSLLSAGSSLPWSCLPIGALLEDADPEGDLYESANVLFEAVDEIAGVGQAIASKLLHIKRPGFVPILDAQLRMLYKDAAARAYQNSPKWRAKRPDWAHLYWAAIRADLVRHENVEALGALRSRLSEEAVADPERSAHRARLVTLTNLRLLDILAWDISKPEQSMP